MVLLPCKAINSSGFPKRNAVGNAISNWLQKSCNFLFHPTCSYQQIIFHSELTRSCLIKIAIPIRKRFSAEI